ncbi:MAG: DUF6230 family protein [Jatrophihabitans sp.]
MHCGDAPAQAAAHGGTRWRRTGVLFIPAIVVLLAMAIATFLGVLPLNIAVSGQDFKITSNGAPIRVPKGLTLYQSTVQMKNGGDTRGVVIAGLPEAILDKGMCLSVVLTFPVVGTYTIQLHTSGKTTVKDMTLDGSSLTSGTANLVPRTSDGKPGNGKNLLAPVVLGEDASDIGGPPGRFAVNAPGSGSLDNLRASAQGAIIAGTADLAGLRVYVHHGRGPSNGECF